MASKYSIRVDSTKWLARWAKSAAEKSEPGVGSLVSSKTFEYGHAGILSLKMFQRNVASWWIRKGGGAVATIRNDGISVFHAGFMHQIRGFWSFTEMEMLISIRRDFRNLEIAMPVVGELSHESIHPVLASTNMAYPPYRSGQHKCGLWFYWRSTLPVVMVSTSIFHHHESAKCQLGIVILKCLNLDKAVQSRFLLDPVFGASLLPNTKIFGC